MMKVRKTLAAILAVSVIGAGMAACSKDDDKKDETEAPAEDTVAEESEDEGTETERAVDGIDLYFVLNGVEVRLGDSYADIKDQLGDEIKPEDKIVPCEGDCEYLSIIHTYEGYTVEENYDGVVCNISINGYESGIGDDLFLGQFKYGDSVADVKAAIDAEPADEGDTYIQYFITDTLCCMINNDENGVFQGASVYDFALSMC